MRRRLSRRPIVGLITALSLVVPVTASAHAAAVAAPTARVEVQSVGHAVKNLDTTVHFYHDVLGLEIVSEDKTFKADPAYGRLTGTVGGKYRSAVIAIPNQKFRLVLTQYAGVAKTAVGPQHHQNPGTPALTLSIKSAVVLFPRLKAAGVQTLNGQPVPDGTTIPTVFFRDPDGYVVETAQRRADNSDWFTVPPPSVTDGPGMKYVIRGQIDLTMWSAQQAIDVYKNALGFDLNPGFPPLIGAGEYKPLGFLGMILGVPVTALWTAVTGNCDPTTRCEYFEYQDPARVTNNPDIQDPGAGLATYTTHHFLAVLSRLIAARVKVVTPGGKAVLVHGHLSIILRDPSGLLLRLTSLQKG
ncbi:hypothetical protein acdb102_05440 [Acidothermaceae bacterium B102]|nr:hypothetical protein acdb102_05440 [Acidothermaceae bacterium B102]